MWQKLQEWYILIIGLCVIAPFLVLASQSGPQPQITTGKEPTAQSGQANGNAAQYSSPGISAQQQKAQAAAPPAQQKTAQQAGAPPSPAPQPSAAAPIRGATVAPPAATTSGQAPSPPKTSASLNGGDVTAGRQVFRKCQACHSLEPGKNIVGPSLAGIIGRKAGAEPNYSYSPAMKQANIVWDAKSLDAYLTDPQKVVPGNKMPFPGLKTEHDRADVLAFLAASGGAQRAATAARQPAPTPSAQPTPPPAQASHAAPGSSIGYIPDARYTLRSGIAEGRMVFIGVGGTINGKVNPVLTASEGQVVQLTLINGEGAEHDIAFPDQNARSPRVTGKGASTTVAFRASKAGDFTYFCAVPGHRLAGMEGQFIVTPKPPPQTLVEADISREPTDLPPPIGKREPQTVRVDMLAVELEGRLAGGTTYGYWTFNGKVPGPFIRVRVGDTVDIHLKNSADSSMIHSVDFHAATGPGGGAAALQVNPGEEKSMTWKALVPGLYVYHCATPMVAEHIANGMYGLILCFAANG
jgi:nitrite reductase (NO-forming)